MMALFPDQIETVDVLDEVLTRPVPALIQFIQTVSSPLILLGAGGKMGPSMAVQARRAALEAGCKLDIVAVSRFSNPTVRHWLESYEIHTISCDLIQRESLHQLPDAENIIYLVGLKFGTTQNPAATWAINTLAPANICLRYPLSRIVALSSGSIYPFVPIESSGAVESEPLTPLGEYANACVARERIFEYYSQMNGTPVALLRLFYAVEMRYGVLVDLAQKIMMDEPIDLTMGFVNWIWQGDANEMILRSLSLVNTPPEPFNLTHPQIQSIRAIAVRFGELLGKTVHLKGSEADTALLGNPATICAELGEPSTPIEVVMRWIAGWLLRKGALLGKPTHFEVRTGRY